MRQQCGAEGRKPEDEYIILDHAVLLRHRLMVWIWVLIPCTAVVHAVTFLEERVWLQGLFDRNSLVAVSHVGHPEKGYGWPRTPSAERKVDRNSIACGGCSIKTLTCKLGDCADSKIVYPKQASSVSLRQVPSGVVYRLFGRVRSSQIPGVLAWIFGLIS